MEAQEEFAAGETGPRVAWRLPWNLQERRGPAESLLLARPRPASDSQPTELSDDAFASFRSPGLSSFGAEQWNITTRRRGSALATVLGP